MRIGGAGFTTDKMRRTGDLDTRTHMLDFFRCTAKLPRSGDLEQLGNESCVRQRGRVELAPGSAPAPNRRPRRERTRYIAEAAAASAPSLSMHRNVWHFARATCGMGAWIATGEHRVGATLPDWSSACQHGACQEGSRHHAALHTMRWACQYICGVSSWPSHAPRPVFRASLCRGGR